MRTRFLSVTFIALSVIFGLFGCAGPTTPGPTAIPTVAVQPTAIPPTAIPPTAIPTNASSSGDSIVEYVTTLDGGAEPLKQPVLLAINAQGDIYVLQAGDQIVKYDKTGKFLTKWGSHGTGDGEFQFIKGNDAGLGITLDAEGNVYVADGINNRIQKFDGNGKFVAKWGKQGSGDGEFNVPNDIENDSSGSVYVTDVLNNRVQVFDRRGNFLRKWGGNGDGEGQFNNPSDILIDRQGNILVGNFNNGWIEKFDSQGKFLMRWRDCGTGNDASIEPIGLTADSRDNLYVADHKLNRICKYDANGKFISTLKLSENAPLVSTLGVPLIDASDTMYVPDISGNKILVFKLKQ